MQRGRFLFLESFFGGSHKAFAEGLARHSAHTVELITLPATYWRWRTRTAALQFADRIAERHGAPIPSTNTGARPLRPTAYDGIIVTDLLDLADLRAFLPDLPVLLYMHESQSSYPLPDGSRPDTDTVMSEIKNAVFADRVLFNSHFHRNSFLESAAELAAGAPHTELEGIVKSIGEKSAVLYPGCTLADLGPAESPTEAPPSVPPAAPRNAAPGYTAPRNTGEGYTGARNAPLIVWNHRWEYDKNPTPFFRTLETLSKEGLAFRLAVVGEQPDYIPREFADAYEALREHIVTWGYLEKREDYVHVLSAGDIVVSTSMQENFGISIVEATAAGCVPLVPERLSYPEIIPRDYHGVCLYSSNAQLVSKLRGFLNSGVPRQAGLREAMLRYDWPHVIGAYNRELDALRESACASK